MKHGAWAMNHPLVRTMSEVVEFAVVAEQAGWDGVFVSDSITDGTTDPWVTLGAIAARTERTTLGTWIAAPAIYQPWRLALGAPSLAQLSRGRLMLGVGLGTGAESSHFAPVSNGLPPDTEACVTDAKAVKPFAWFSVVTQIASSSGIGVSPSLLA